MLLLFRVTIRKKINSVEFFVKEIQWAVYPPLFFDNQFLANISLVTSFREKFQEYKNDQQEILHEEDTNQRSILIIYRDINIWILGTSLLDTEAQSISYLGLSS